MDLPKIPKYVMFDGGYPIKVDGHVIDTLAVSSIFYSLFPVSKFTGNSAMEWCLRSY